MTASQNTAVGNGARLIDGLGSYNTAVGWWSLHSNTMGDTNIAVGYAALDGNTTGSSNVAVGWEALGFNTTGYGNVAVGPLTGGGGTGSDNVAIGDRAMANTIEGSFNTAVGYSALSYCTGSHNIGLGEVAGVQLTGGSENIDIGNQGRSNDHRTIRIGSRTQEKAFIGGINGTTIPAGAPVVINAEGQLGTVTSSARYKEAIQPMDNASEAILALQPVTFRYKKELDSEGIPQFGLVAEQVERVNPDLVARDDQGKPYTVRYEAVNAMLLNEFLKEHGKVAEQERSISRLESIVVRQQKEITALSAQVRRVSEKVELSEPLSDLVVSDR